MLFCCYMNLNYSLRKLGELRPLQGVFLKNNVMQHLPKNGSNILQPDLSLAKTKKGNLSYNKSKVSVRPDLHSPFS